MAIAALQVYPFACCVSALRSLRQVFSRFAVKSFFCKDRQGFAEDAKETGAKKALRLQPALPPLRKSSTTSAAQVFLSWCSGSRGGRSPAALLRPALRILL